MTSAHHDSHGAATADQGMTAEEDLDSRTDTIAITVVFVTAVFACLLVVSGFDGALGILGLA